MFVYPWPPLLPGTLIRRYKRFLADIRLRDGTLVTAHCPNSGSMASCSEPGRPVYVSTSDNPRRKLRYTWQLIDMASSLVGVNTTVPNALVAGSIAAGQVDELSGYDGISTEVRVSAGSRIDIRLDGGRNSHCYVEVKNCTLVDSGVARFPDAVTTRGLKHLKELQALIAAGHRGVMFFLVQRMDAGLFKPAADIDPAYAAELVRAAGQGLEILAYDVRIDLKGIRLNARIPCELGALPG